MFIVRIIHKCGGKKAKIFNVRRGGACTNHATLDT